MVQTLRQGREQSGVLAMTPAELRAYLVERMGQLTSDMDVALIWKDWADCEEVKNRLDELKRIATKLGVMP
jgi:hypothetical protein